MVRDIMCLARVFEKSREGSSVIPLGFLGIHSPSVSVHIVAVAQCLPQLAAYDSLSM